MSGGALPVRTGAGRSWARALRIPSAVLVLALVVGASCPAPPTPPSDPGEAVSDPTSDLMVLMRRWKTPEDRVATDIWRMFSNGTGQTRITSTGSPKGDVAVSPFGTEVAFEAEDGVWVMAVDGTHLRRVAGAGGGLGSVGDPAWSPNGHDLVVRREGGGGTPSALIVLDPDDFFEPRVIYTAGPGNQVSQPSWSPDGEHVVFREEGTSSGLFVVEADPGRPVAAGARTALVQGTSVQDPGWSPDGSRVAFLEELTGGGAVQSVLYTVTLPGGSPPSSPIPRSRWDRVHDNVRSFAWSPGSDEFAVVLDDDQLYTTSGPFDLSERLTHWNGPQAIGGWVDGTPLLSVHDAVVTEGDDGRVQMRFRLTLSVVPDQAVGVDWTTGDSFSGRQTATPDVDFESRTGQTIFTPGGTIERVVVVWVLGDHVTEPNEYVELFIDDVENGAEADSRAFGTIVDDDLGGEAILDPTFGNGGRVTTDLGGQDVAYGVAVQPDGKIVVVGTASEGVAMPPAFALARYLPDGTLDPDFGTGGLVLSPSAGQAAHAVAIRPDGHIVVAGVSGDDIAVARYRPDGTLHPEFGGGDGVVTTDVGFSPDVAEAVALQPDAKIVVAGYTQDPGGDEEHVVVVRYTQNGTPDVDFGTRGDGVVTTSFGAGRRDRATSVAVQSDGRIVAGGRSETATQAASFALVRYLQDGTLDPAYGVQGKVLASIGPGADHAEGGVMQDDDKMVLVGLSRRSATGFANDFAVARFRTDGTLDPTFGTGGATTTPIGATAVAHDAAIHPDGRIVAAGDTRSGTEEDFALARYLPDGRLDPSFAGTVVTHVATDTEAAMDVAIQSDGRVVAVGFTVAVDADFALVRYLLP